MPLKKGKSKKVLAENIAEFHHGKTYARTARKFGKATANKQAVAAAYSQRRRSGRR
jgi:aminoglycoside phosphotransferase family enzyme